MREIIFKARRLDNGEWVFGDLNHFSDGRAAIADSEQDWFLVDPETVCQYTGLEDRKGCRIFENDIVEYQLEPDGTPIKGADKRINGRVFFSEWRASFSVTAGKRLSKCINNDLFNYVRNGNWVEVIGNIYDSKVVKTDAQANSV